MTKQELEAELLVLFGAENDYGCGFYNDAAWRASYKRLATAVGLSKCPIHSDWMRAACDKCAAETELAAARAKVAELEKRLGKKPAEPIPVKVRTELDETDAGSGVPEPRVNGQSAEDFRGELHMLRQRNKEKRRNREH